MKNKSISSKESIFYYGSKEFGFVAKKNIEDYTIENKEKYGKIKKSMAVSLKKLLVLAIEEADEENLLAIEKRIGYTEKYRPLYHTDEETKKSTKKSKKIKSKEEEKSKDNSNADKKDACPYKYCIKDEDIPVCSDTMSDIDESVEEEYLDGTKPNGNYSNGDCHMNEQSSAHSDIMTNDIDNQNSENADSSYQYGDMVWAKGASSMPWWPGCIYDPVQTPLNLRDAAIACKHNKKHVVCYYGDSTFGFISEKNLEVFNKNTIEKYSLEAGKSSKAIQKAVTVAEWDTLLPRERRFAWNLGFGPVKYVPYLEKAAKERILNQSASTCHSDDFIDTERLGGQVLLEDPKLLQKILRKTNSDVEPINTNTELNSKNNVTSPSLSSPSNRSIQCPESPVNTGVSKENKAVDPTIQGDRTVTDNFVSVMGKLLYGEVVWARGSNSYPWWPSCICDPKLAPDNIREQAQNQEKNNKFVVYYYASNQFGFVGSKHVKPYTKLTIHNFIGQNMDKKYKDYFASAVELANEEINLWRDKRAHYLVPENRCFKNSSSGGSSNPSTPNKKRNLTYISPIQLHPTKKVTADLDADSFKLVV